MHPFLIGPDNTFEWVTCFDFLFMQRPHDFDCGHRSDVPIEIASLWDTVDMGAEKDHRRRSVLALTAAIDRPGRIYPNLQSRARHQRIDDKPAGLNIRTGPGNATDAPFRVAAELR